MKELFKIVFLQPAQQFIDNNYLHIDPNRLKAADRLLGEPTSHLSCQLHLILMFQTSQRGEGVPFPEAGVRIENQFIRPVNVR